MNTILSRIGILLICWWPILLAFSFLGGIAHSYSSPEDKTSLIQQTSILLFIFWTLIYIHYKCIRKNILRLPLIVSLTFYLLILFLIIIWAYKEWMHIERFVCDWGCYEETLDSFFEKRSTKIIKNLDQSHLESIIWKWTSYDWGQVEIKKNWPHYFYNDDNYLIISSNRDYIAYWPLNYYGDKIKNQTGMTINQDHLYRDKRFRLYITSKWLEFITVAEKDDEYFKGRHHQYVR